MGILSKFHELYLNNKDFYDSEAKRLLKHEFMKKYNIGNGIYYMYFRGMNGRVYVAGGLDEEKKRLRIENISNKAIERRYDDMTYFNEKIESISRRLRVSKKEIKKLTEKYTVSELEMAEKINGEIVCYDLIIMRKPTNFHESMYNLNTSMV